MNKNSIIEFNKIDDDHMKICLLLLTMKMQNKPQSDISIHPHLPKIKEQIEVEVVYLIIILHFIFVRSILIARIMLLKGFLL